MLEFVIIIACLSAIIVGLIVAIPFMVKLQTDADANPDHIYTIFMRESGPRGMYITLPALVTMPIVVIANPPDEFMYIFGFVVFAVIALYLQLSIYQDYNVLNSKMRRILAILVTTLILLAMLAKHELINDGLYIFLHCSISIYWGGLAVYKRSKLIKHNQALKRTP